MTRKAMSSSSRDLLVSIIIPTFNEEKNITRLLQSIKAQSHKKIEVIVVDDGSRDGTAEIAKEYTDKVFKRKHAERSVQRNFGASKARGAYLLIIDADMELTKDVVKSCLSNIGENKALIIPEKTVGDGLMATVRAFEREMYMGDPAYEVARFFEKKVFDEFGGYDPNLTGTEDYDLPKRVNSKYKIGWSKAYILHHEAQRTLLNQLTRKFYYASKSALYAKKYPELIAVQGNLLFRKAYFRNWRKFVKRPILGLVFIFVRLLEAIFAIAGFISAVGFIEFVRTFFRIFENKK